MIGSQIHRGLLWIDPLSGNYVGAAARSWEYGALNTTIKFDLNLDMHFHDGSALNCDLVKRSFERLSVNKSDTSIVFPSGTRFECESNSKFLIKLPFIPAKFLDFLSSPAAAIVKDDGLIGLGPYALESVDPFEVSLRRASGGGPKKIKFIIADHQNLIRMFDDGKLDDLLYLGLFLDVPNDCQKMEGLSPTSFWLGINAKSWGFERKENRLIVQRLLRMAIKKSNIFKNEIRNDSLIPFGVSGSRTPSGDEFEREIRRARGQVLGLVNKFGKIELTFRKIQYDAYNWKGLFDILDPKNVLFKVKFVDNDDFFKSYYKGKLSVYFVGGNISRDDPFEVLSYFRKGDFVNQSGVQQPVVDELLERAARATSSDDVRRFAQEANDWIISEGYAVPLFSKKFRGCVQSYLRGYRLSLFGPLSLDYSQVRFEGGRD